MSQIIQTQTTIVPDRRLLRRCLEEIRARYDGIVLDYYIDIRGTHHLTNTGLALHIPRRKGHPLQESLPRGIGLLTSADGSLTFVGDDYGVESFYQQIKRELIQQYQLEAIKIVLQKKRMRIGQVRQDGGRLLIKAVHRG